jgi:hypothetical protein
MRQDEKTKIMPTPKKEDIEKRLGRASAMNTARKGDGGFVPARQARTENKAPEVRRKEGARAEEPQPLREELKKETRREKNKHLPSPFSGLMLAIILVIFIYAVVTFSVGSTKIERIEVVGEDVELNQEIVNICSHLEGRSYLFLNTKAEKKEILKKSPLIYDISFKGRFPRALKVIVRYENPDFYTVSGDYIYTLNSELKILTKHDIKDSDVSLSREGLTKLSLPEFKEANAGDYLEFTGDGAYIKRVCDALCDYDKFGEISFINLTNTQRIYFIFDTRFRCDLGDSQQIEVKLIAAENIYRNKLTTVKQSSPDRTAVINVSDPSFGSIRTDVDLGITE